MDASAVLATVQQPSSAARPLLPTVYRAMIAVLRAPADPGTNPQRDARPPRTPFRSSAAHRAGEREACPASPGWPLARSASQRARPEGACSGASLARALEPCPPAALARAAASEHDAATYLTAPRFGAVG